MREVEDPAGIDRTLQATDEVPSETVRGSRRLLTSDGTPSLVAPRLLCWRQARGAALERFRARSSLGEAEQAGNGGRKNAEAFGLIPICAVG